MSDDTRPLVDPVFDKKYASTFERMMSYPPSLSLGHRFILSACGFKYFPHPVSLAQCVSCTNTVRDWKVKLLLESKNWDHADLHQANCAFRARTAEFECPRCGTTMGSLASWRAHLIMQHLLFVTLDFKGELIENSHSGDRAAASEAQVVVDIGANKRAVVDQGESSGADIKRAKTHHAQPITHDKATNTEVVDELLVIAGYDSSTKTIQLRSTEDILARNKVSRMDAWEVIEAITPPHTERNGEAVAQSQDNNSGVRLSTLALMTREEYGRLQAHIRAMQRMLL